jgi:hypothetical protein
MNDVRHLIPQGKLAASITAAGWWRAVNYTGDEVVEAESEKPMPRTPGFDGRVSFNSVNTATVTLIGPFMFLFS